MIRRRPTARGEEASVESLMDDGVHGKLLQILQLLGDGVAIIDNDCSLRLVNSALREILGPPDGKRCHEYFFGRPEPCQGCNHEEILSGTTERHQYATTAGDIYDVVHTAINNEDGTTSELSIFRRSHHVEDQAGESGTTGEARSGGSGKSKDLVWRIDPGGRFTFVSPASKPLLGYDPEELAGVSIGRVITEDAFRTVTEQFHRARLPRDGVTIELEMQRKDGTAIIGESTIIPVRCQSGALVGLAGVTRDITSRRRADEAGARRTTRGPTVRAPAGRRGDNGSGTKTAKRPVECSFCRIVGCHPTMLELYQTIRDVSKVDVPVLIQGESGTGKELVATAIHQLGPRAERPFVPVNCSALPESLLESELFGHVRGAFSGAIRDKKGRFELADGGTIFLDEVGELSPAIQASLLRVLQEGTFERVGGEKTLRVNARVISATNKDLRRMIGEGTFRDDLYYRLCGLPISTPPLRDRLADLHLIAGHILNQYSAEVGRGEVALGLPALEALGEHDWPGNVRELQNAIRYALVKCRGSSIWPEHLPPSVRSTSTAERVIVKRGRRPKISSRDVARALEETGGNRMAAARRLGVSRATLYKHLRQ